eukprot:TRINITY_DN790_c0_g1_i2.p1 TRINITY_DN790_c0_g1~~TRINITY_DN790_c0_g1_i2.p1  ORF type:complete len:252 (-),score=52.54 TRINITY_DN790_c0_g1_i2:298-1053(-)
MDNLNELFGTFYAVSEHILGDQCTTTLFRDFDVSSDVCVKLFFSKVLSALILTGSLIVKVPQIANIWRSQSVTGLNLSMFTLELFGYLLSFTYAYHRNFPFSTYGESVSIFVQNAVILLLFARYDSVQRYSALFWLFVISASSGFLILGSLGDLLDYLKLLTIGIFISSKLPQIFTNYKQGNTGQLSVITSALNLGGSLARVFTTLQEVNDEKELAGYLLSSFLNAILMFQIIWYWKAVTQKPAPVASKPK